jgi:hypothetical protein
MRARHVQALAGLVVLGAVLRFATLDAQSFWLDEAATIDLLRKGFGDMLEGIPNAESTPPLYYVLAWLWTQLAGTGEVGARSLSALAGTATIPVAYVLGSWAAGRRAGLIAAALAATNPFLIWYSQEARAYALLVLLTGLGLVLFLRALEQPATRRLIGWGIVSALALATHYFALFPVAAEALWLLLLTGRRRALPALAVVGAAGLALLPLALDQGSNDNANFIEQTSLAHRLAQVPKQFFAGYDAPLETALTIAALIAVGAGLAGLLRAGADARRRATVLAAIGAVTIGVPAVLALSGPDFLLARNVLPAWLPLAAVVATGFAAMRWGTAMAATLALLGTVIAIAVAADPAYQRDDWRGAAKALGPPERDRTIIVTPASGILPLSLYLPRSRPTPAEGVDVTEIGLVGLASRAPGDERKPPRPKRDPQPAPIFGQIIRVDGETYTSVLFRADSALRVFPNVGQSPMDGRPAKTLFQPLK